MGSHYVQIGKYYMHFVAVYIIVVIYIMCYHLCRKLKLLAKDTMNEKWFTWPVTHDVDGTACEEGRYHVSDLDGWSLSHLLMNFVLGYLFPDNLLLFMIIGIIWEFIEQYIHVQSLYDDELITEKWWVGVISDVGMNSMGLILGNTFSPFRQCCH